MAATYLYLKGADVEQLLTWLNGEAEIAFLVSDGADRWRAVPQVGSLPDGEYRLWHIPGGPLPRLGPGNEPSGVISDPWSGWTDQRTITNSQTPYLGSPPNVLELNLWRHGSPSERSGLAELPTNYLGVSSFGWIGNHYSVLGSRAAPETERWWKRLNRWVKKTGVRVLGCVPVNSPPLNIYAFPEAMEAIIAGVPRYESNYRPVA